ncbi:MAG TPA: hypothetical protein VD794_07645 [Flavisolibacter sp.]|nr:hypothetical protein [Flavisolibacter sp.]
MKKLFTGILLSLLLMCTSAFAQRNFIPASIELASREKISGYIDYRNWVANPKTIAFKRTESDNVEEYTTHDLYSFQIPGKDEYIKAIVWKDIQPLQLDKLVNYSMPSVLDTVFLRTLVKGEKISLYELIDEKAHYFIAPQNDTLQELQYKRLQVGTTHDYYNDYNTFRDQLKRYISADGTSSKLQRQIESANYKSKDLVNLVKAINNNTATIISSSEKVKNKPQFFVAGGITYNTTSIKGRQDFDVFKNIKDPFLSYTFSVGGDLFPRRGLKNVFLRTEVRLSNNAYKGDVEVYLPYSPPNYKERRTYSLKMTTVTPSLLAGYNVWIKEKSRVYLAAGVGFNIANYSDNVYTTTNLSTEDISVQKNYLELEKLWAEYFISAGVVVNKRIEAKIIYRVLGTFEKYQTVDSKLTTIGLMSAFRF